MKNSFIASGSAVLAVDYPVNKERRILNVRSLVAMVSSLARHTSEKATPVFVHPCLTIGSI